MVMECSVLTLARWQDDTESWKSWGAGPSPGLGAFCAQLSSLAAPRTPGPLRGPQRGGQQGPVPAPLTWASTAPGTHLLTGGMVYRKLE